MGVRILSDELESLLRSQDLFVSSALVIGNGSRLAVQGVAHNTHDIRGGELFIGLVGATFNGGVFAADAIERGAALCLINQAAAAVLSSDVLNNCIVVSDTLKAFWRLARWWAAKVSIPIVAVTGSVGKTTVKEMIAALLVSEGPGVYSQASYNNYVGVPATLCRADFHHKWGVVEVGTNSPGEIAQIASLFVARVAIVTCVTEAHLEQFQSCKEVLQEKLDIVKTLTPGGVLMVYGDDDDLYREALEITAKTGISVKTFGTIHQECQVSTTRRNDIIVQSLISHGIDGIEVTLCTGGNDDSHFQWEETFQLRLPGMHNGLNVAASVGAALEIFPNLNLEGIKRRLARFRPLVMQMQVIQTEIGVRVLCDCFNVNLKSMQAFLDVAQDEIQLGCRVVLVVGDMQVIGERSAADRHREVFERARTLGALKVIFVGEGFKAIFFEYLNQQVENIEWHITPESVIAALTSLIRLDNTEEIALDLIMLKGPQALQLRALIDTLIESLGGEMLQVGSRFFSSVD